MITDEMTYTAETYTVLCDMYRLPLSPELWPSHVIAYHLTTADRMESILANGLVAESCVATTFGQPRTPAVYLFAHVNDTTDGNVRGFLFETEDDVAVVKVRIPREAFANMREDGLFAVSCVCEDGSAPYAVQYRDNIPAEWIIA